MFDFSPFWLHFAKFSSYLLSFCYLFSFFRIILFIFPSILYLFAIFSPCEVITL